MLNLKITTCKMNVVTMICIICLLILLIFYIFKNKEFFYSATKINKIKISLNKKEFLQLGEVQVLDKKGKNLIERGGRNGILDQSEPFDKDTTAIKAVNGNTLGKYRFDVAITKKIDNPFWSFKWNTPIELSEIAEIRIYNRKDNTGSCSPAKYNCPGRLNGAIIELLLNSTVVKKSSGLKYDPKNQNQVYIYDSELNSKCGSHNKKNNCYYDTLCSQEKDCCNDFEESCPTLYEQSQAYKNQTKPVLYSKYEIDKRDEIFDIIDVLCKNKYKRDRSKLTRISYYELMPFNIKYIMDNTFNLFPNIKSVEFIDKDITFVHSKTFPNNPKLHTINFRDTPIDTIGCGLLKNSLDRYVGNIFNIIKISIESGDKKRTLSLAEVEVLDKDGNNLIRPSGVLAGTVSQINTNYGGKAEFAVNGETDGKYWRSRGIPKVTHTQNTEDPWWTFTWNAPIKLSDIKTIKIYARTDACCARGIDDAKVELYNNDKLIMDVGNIVYDETNTNNQYEFDVFKIAHEQIDAAKVATPGVISSNIIPYHAKIVITPLLTRESKYKKINIIVNDKFLEEYLGKSPSPREIYNTIYKSKNKIRLIYHSLGISEDNMKNNTVKIYKNESTPYNNAELLQIFDVIYYKDMVYTTDFAKWRVKYMNKDEINIEQREGDKLILTNSKIQDLLTKKTGFETKSTISASLNNEYLENEKDLHSLFNIYMKYLNSFTNVSLLQNNNKSLEQIKLEIENFKKIIEGSKTKLKNRNYNSFFTIIDYNSINYPKSDENCPNKQPCNDSISFPFKTESSLSCSYKYIEPKCNIEPEFSIDSNYTIDTPCLSVTYDIDKYYSLYKYSEYQRLLRYWYIIRKLNNELDSDDRLKEENILAEEFLFKETIQDNYEYNKDLAVFLGITQQV